LALTYRYSTSDGQSHEVTTFGHRSVKTAVEAQLFLDQHPVGSAPTISANPRDPDQIKFDVDVNVATLWQPFAGAALCLLLSRRAPGRLA
jgi:hypothetical protein